VNSWVLVIEVGDLKIKSEKKMCIWAKWWLWMMEICYWRINSNKMGGKTLEQGGSRTWEIFLGFECVGVY
jgi:hypothetical protein